MAAAWNTATGNNATNLPKGHESVSVGVHLDGSAGGNYVKASDVRGELFRNYSPVSAVAQSKFIPFIKNYGNETLMKIMPKAMNISVTVRWLAPIIAKKMSACDVKMTVTQRKAATQTLKLDQYAYATDLFMCDCDAQGEGNYTGQDLYEFNSIEEKTLSADIGLAEVYDAYIIEELAKEVVALEDKYNVTEEEGSYKQIYRGLAMVKEKAMTKDANGFKIDSKLIAKNLVIYINAITESDINTDIKSAGRRSSSEFNYAGKNLYDFMISTNTIAGFINDVPIVPVEQEELDKLAGAGATAGKTNWVIVNNFNHAFDQVCTDMGIKEGALVNGEISTDTAFYKKTGFGFLSLKDLYPNAISVRSIPFKTATTS